MKSFHTAACMCGYFNSFSVPCTIRSWNSLSTSVTKTNSIASFKLNLWAHRSIFSFCYFVSLHICKNFYKTKIMLTPACSVHWSEYKNSLHTTTHMNSTDHGIWLHHYRVYNNVHLWTGEARQSPCIWQLHTKCKQLNTSFSQCLNVIGSCISPVGMRIYQLSTFGIKIWIVIIKFPKSKLAFLYAPVTTGIEVNGNMGIRPEVDLKNVICLLPRLWLSFMELFGYTSCLYWSSCNTWAHPIIHKYYMQHVLSECSLLLHVSSMEWRSGCKYVQSTRCGNSSTECRQLGGCC